MPLYTCSQCGTKVNSKEKPSVCDECKIWNTFELPLSTSLPDDIVIESKPIKLSRVEVKEHPRLITKIDGLDLVTGGGFVIGSITLLAGDPGIGKSTLAFQACDVICDKLKKKVMYVSGEESDSQVRLSTDRLNLNCNWLLLNEPVLEIIFSHCQKEKVEFLVLDSAQTVRTLSCSSAQGSPNQVRESGNIIQAFVKTRNITTLIIGHVTKDSAIAGPKTLEHIVDTVAFISLDEENEDVRILKASKNRFGSTRPRGLFEMTPTGLLPFKRESKDDNYY